MDRRKRSEMTKAERIAARIERHDKQTSHVETRAGPERAKGETTGEYRERVKRHDYVTERQVTLRAAHRELFGRRLAKALDREKPAVQPEVIRPERPHRKRARRS